MKAAIVAAAEAPRMLELRHASKSFGATPALRDVTLVAEPGCTTALLGPSECVKSTVLRLLVGLPLDALDRYPVHLSSEQRLEHTA